MCGVSGSGKTHFARALEGRGYTRLSPDALVWAEYGAEITRLPFEQQRPIFAEANRLLLERLGRLIDEGRPVVVDSTMCNRDKRDAARAVCAARGLNPLLIYLDTPLDILKERLAQRTGDGPDDQIVAVELLERFYINFDAPHTDEPHIKL